MTIVLKKIIRLVVYAIFFTAIATLISFITGKTSQEYTYEPGAATAYADFPHHVVSEGDDDGDDCDDGDCG